MGQDIVYTKWNWVTECLALNVSFSRNKEETKEETAIWWRIIRAQNVFLVLFVSFWLDMIDLPEE